MLAHLPSQGAAAALLLNHGLRGLATSALAAGKKIPYSFFTHVPEVSLHLAAQPKPLRVCGGDGSERWPGVPPAGAQGPHPRWVCVAPSLQT